MTLLITQNDYLNLLPVDRTIEWRWTAPYFSVAQTARIRPFLGNDLTDELENQTQTNTLTPANVALLDNYLKQALAWYIYGYATNSESLRSEAKGLRINKDDTSDSVSAGLVEKIRMERFDIANMWLNETGEFLNQNKDDYPLWKAKLCENTGNVPQSYGVYLGNADVTNVDAIFNRYINR